MHHLLNRPFAFDPGELKARIARAKLVTAEQVAAWERDPGRIAARAWHDEHPEEPSDRVTIDQDEIATIRIAGGLTAADDFWSWLFGDLTYSAIERDFDLVLAKGPRAIVVDWSSGGGDAEGPQGLSRRIFEARGKTPIYSLIRGGAYCASAAYYVGSAADKIIVEPAGIVGSIGTIMEFVDFSKADELAGIETITLRSTQSPHKRPDPTTAEGQARYQAVIDALTDVFGGDVARNRGTTAEEVFARYGQGDVMVGQAAVAAGLADTVGTFDDIRAEVMAGRRSSVFFPAARISAAASQEKPIMKCESCGADPMKCADCNTEAKADAAALGLPETANSAARRDRMRVLSRLGEVAITATAAKSLDEAIGRVTAQGEAVRELAAMRAAQARAAEEATAREWREVLTAAATDNPPRLTPAQLVNMVPALLEGERAEKAKAQATTVNATNPPNRIAALIDAVCLHGITAAEVVRLRACTTAPSLPAPMRERPAAGSLTPAAVKNALAAQTVDPTPEQVALARFYGVDLTKPAKEITR